ncbi:MAG TPA: hypothetical protein VJ892_04055 [Candidatus Absconditabacterales bacterium]|nr:hypothetical protein [Candidatus Absconditabacterales bacterium]
MTQNNEILEKLIGDNKENNSNSNKVPTGSDDEVLITTSRVVGVRYKIYTIIILVLLFIIGYNYILPSWDQNQSESVELTNIELQMLNFENKKNQYDSNKGLVDKIKQVESQAVDCVNMLEGCSELPNIVKENFGTVRSYLLLNEMMDEKMQLDEKMILANIDGFLLKKFPLNENSRATNGVLNKISIGEKQQFDQSLYFVPIELNITFENKEGLLSFIDNVEKKIPTDSNLRMLYKIDEINYDIVNSDQVQDANVFMYLYFYQK